MSELNQDVEKIAENIRKTEGFAEAAKQRALNAVNNEASWMERHAKLVTWGAVVAIVALIVLAIKAF